MHFPLFTITNRILVTLRGSRQHHSEDLNYFVWKPILKKMPIFLTGSGVTFYLNKTRDKKLGLDSPEDLDLLSGCFCGFSADVTLRSNLPASSFAVLSWWKLSVVAGTVFRGLPLFPGGLFSSLPLTVVCVLLDLGRLLFFFMAYSILGLSAADPDDGVLLPVPLERSAM